MSWSVLAFIVWPYIALSVFVVGHIWRWRTDKFGLTTRTSEISEKKWLMWASPTFHLGLLLVVLGHGLGLLVPPSVTAALGVPESVYHLVAMVAGVMAGIVLVIGIVLLVLRRFILKTRLRLVTRPGDIVIYVLLVLTITCGMWATIQYTVLNSGYDYRETVSVWFRSIFYANPSVGLMAVAPLAYKIHVICAFGVFAAWPFSRLVHLWSAPVGYLTRPLIVYRPSASQRAKG